MKKINEKRTEKRKRINEIRKHQALIISLLIISSLLITSCAQIEKVNSNHNFETNNNPQSPIIEKTFTSKQDLKNFLQEHNAGNSYYHSFGTAKFAVASLESSNPSPTANERTINDYSTTNVQVKGIDEGDIIKTDGTYLYVISEKTIYIIKAYPGKEAEIISTIKISEGNPQGLLIRKNRLAVFGSINNYKPYKEIGILSRNGMTFFKLYDISNKEEPELKKDIVLEGYYQDSREKDDYAYIIVKSTPNHLRPEPMPIILSDGIIKKVPVTKIHYFNIPYNNAEYETIHSISMESGIIKDSETLIVEGNNNLYMSHDNAYITYTKYINEWEIKEEIAIKEGMKILDERGKEIADKIKKTDPLVLTENEKKNKLMNLIESYVRVMPEEKIDELEEKTDEETKKELKKYDYREYTVIHKISINKGNLELKASGKVPGSIINQFSMDEHKGILRIATTANQYWSRYDNKRTESTNMVFTLDEKLRIIDSLKNIAEGERIYSTRFIGDKLYLVTFRRIDPFFVIDLSNPEKIKSLGKLKIPGFSSYLHPYDNNTIIGLGRETTDSGRQQGIKISLFDVSNPEEPKEIAKYVSKDKYSSSTAEYEHKAFLFSREKNLLVIPINYHGSKTNEQYAGALVFNITKNSITPKGLVLHPNRIVTYKTGIARPLYPTRLERSLYIEDELYTMSPGLIRINNLEDLSPIKNITLTTKTNPDEIPVY